MLNYLKLHKKWVGVITLILLIVKLSLEYETELLKSKPKPQFIQTDSAKCVNIYNECIRHTQGEIEGDYFSFACERVKSLCEKSCSK